MIVFELSVIEAGSKTPVNPPPMQLLSVFDEAPHTVSQTGQMNMAKMMDKASSKKVKLRIYLASEV